MEVNMTLQPLRNFVRQNLPQLRSSPCLLITSSPPLDASINDSSSPTKNYADQTSRQQQTIKYQNYHTNKKNHAFVQRNAQSLAYEFNLHTVPFTISSAFPTIEGVNEAVALAKRAGLKQAHDGSSSCGGEGVVIGIGSGAVIDLATAVADTLFGNSSKGGDEWKEGGKLILAPSTIGGLWAASSTCPSLILDTKEEMLLPHLSQSLLAQAKSIGNGGSITSITTGRNSVVTLDPLGGLSMPPLHSFSDISTKKTISPSTPSMAHVAAAALVILLDVARTLDASISLKERSNLVELERKLIQEMKVVATSCVWVLNLAASEVRGDTNTPDDAICNENEPLSEELAQQYLIDIVRRLSFIIDRSQLIAPSDHFFKGTMPQVLANALLPKYFPQCHLLTYLACVLPGLCDVLAASHLSGNRIRENGNVNMVQELVRSIIKCSGENLSKSNNDAKHSFLSTWASQITEDAGIPSMASLAFGTPDLSSLAASIDAYEALMASTLGGSGLGRWNVKDETWILENVLQRSLNR